MNSEILAGIRNAVIRGGNLEKVAESFINAGYSGAEVREVIDTLQKGTLNISPNPQPVAVKPIQTNTVPVQQTNPLPKNQTARDIKSFLSNPFKKKTQPLPMSMPTQSQQPQTSKPSLLSGSLQQTQIKKVRFDPVLIVLVAVLIGLFGLLIFSLLFKEQILNFLG